MDNYNLIKKIIKAIGDDPEREGLLDTPKRVVKSWDTIFGGYKQKPKDILTLIPSMYKSDIDELTELLDPPKEKDDRYDQLVEAYNFLSKTHLKKYLAFLQEIVKEDLCKSPFPKVSYYLTQLTNTDDVASFES